MIARDRSWARRHVWIIAATLAILALSLDAGYQVYASRIAGQNAATAAAVEKIAPKVTTLTKVQCANTRLFYEVFNALVEDSSPSFGSPRDGPPSPGARRRLIDRLYASEREAAKPLRAQGCKVSTP